MHPLQLFMAAMYATSKIAPEPYASKARKMNEAIIWGWIWGIVLTPILLIGVISGTQYLSQPSESQRQASAASYAAYLKEFHEEQCRGIERTAAALETWKNRDPPEYLKEKVREDVTRRKTLGCRDKISD